MTTTTPTHASTLPSLLSAFLGCPTPTEWLVSAPEHLETLIIDHANCEKKAANTALSLLYRYTDKTKLLKKLSQLAREELLHFEQVVDIMQQRGIPYRAVSAAHYASGLHRHARREEPGRLIDALIIGAFIEARSCERFHSLIPYVDQALAQYYRYLLKSESRHFIDYLNLARHYHDQQYHDHAEPAHFEERVAFFRHHEAKLILTPNQSFRFHSGPLDAAASPVTASLSN
ncbi:MAG: tRNA-(ms[2]io[6]A)-hydroxylase [Gammaproteobacteria bacterium]